MIILMMSLKEREFMLSDSFKVGLGVLGWFIILILKIWIVITLLFYVAKSIGLIGLRYWIFSIVGTVWCLYILGTFNIEDNSNSLNVFTGYDKEE